jgi:DNA-binding NtrC family response regulator
MAAATDPCWRRQQHRRCPVNAMASTREQFDEISALHDAMASVARECAISTLEPTLLQRADSLRRLAAARAISLADHILHPHCPPVSPPAGRQSAATLPQPSAESVASHQGDQAAPGNDAAYLTALLHHFDGNVRAAARAVHMQAHTLRRLCDKLGVARSHTPGRRKQ